jgi:hypothetical protein
VDLPLPDLPMNRMPTPDGCATADACRATPSLARCLYAMRVNAHSISSPSLPRGRADDDAFVLGVVIVNLAHALLQRPQSICPVALNATHMLECCLRLANDDPDRGFAAGRLVAGRIAPKTGPHNADHLGPIRTDPNGVAKGEQYELPVAHSGPLASCDSLPRARPNSEHREACEFTISSSMRRVIVDGNCSCR